MNTVTLETWRQVFRAAASKLELASVDLDEKGNCSIVPSNNAVPAINIVFDAESGVVDIFSELGFVPDSDPGVYRELLFDNLFGEKTKGATYAAVRATGRIVLQRGFEVGSVDDGEALAAVLADFVEAAYAGRRLIYRSVLGEGENSDAQNETSEGLAQA